jgi:hypothetical protein
MSVWANVPIGSGQTSQLLTSKGPIGYLWAWLFDRLANSKRRACRSCTKITSDYKERCAWGRFRPMSCACGLWEGCFGWPGR